MGYLSRLEMIADWKYWACANVLIKRHGWRDAFLHAMGRAEELGSAGDYDGQIVWRRIARAIVELEQVERRGAVHLLAGGAKAQSTNPPSGSIRQYGLALHRRRH